MFKLSGAGILEGNSFRGGGKRLGADSGEMALLSRKERGALLSHKELLGKGDDAETP